MSARIPESYLDLFEKPAFAHIATVMPDGSPQVTPVWIDYDGEYLLVNSARGRVKDRNMEARPQVAVEILDPDNPYRYLTIRGRVVEIIEEGAADHINHVLAPKYTGKPGEFGASGEIRRLYRIRADYVSASG
jgi:PPOX class probable F420-dependent enzyme